jgi:hypothetical protein
LRYMQCQSQMIHEQFMSPESADMCTRYNTNTKKTLINQ